MKRRSRRTLEAMLEDGLCRLAFGDQPDAARLQALGHLDEAEAAGISLFHVSSIKWAKDGVEVKFFDRFKAIELLARLESRKGGEGAELFYRALSQGLGRDMREGRLDA